MSEQKVHKEKVFKLDFKPDSVLLRSFLTVFKKPIELLLNFKELNRIHQRAVEVHREGEQFSDTLLDVMNIEVELDEKCFSRIPKEGNVVVISNHPFGGIEGVILGSILRKVRPDSKIMANVMLERIPELRDLFFFVNPFETKTAVRENLKSMKDTIAHLKDGGALGIFPAGTVSHMTYKNREVTDPEWGNSVARIIRKTNAPVLPLYFSGQNGMAFQIAGLIHPRLRTALLPRQFTNKQKQVIRVSVGKLIPHPKIKSFANDDELTRYLRQRTYLLQTLAESKESAGGVEKESQMSQQKQNYEPIIDPVDPELLIKDIEGLDDGQLLLTNNEYEVYYAAHRQIPNIMREIGRLREYSFRGTDEGTGKSIDIDKYDQHYMHMFVWQREKKELVGAYRLGRTDNILKRVGKEGLYTTTLFKVKTGLLEKISPALEMGRSFVRPEYQRSFAPLMLLWKGIGHYVVKYPKYKNLFGPVSISNDYETGSRNLMVTFLRLNNFLPDLAKQVKPKSPFKAKSKKAPWITALSKKDLIDIDDLSEAISHIESDAKGVPILLKQYLKLGGKLLGFNVDHDFADALDGLILVDLTQTDPNLLVRYMGKEGMDAFLNYHKEKEKSEELDKLKENRNGDDISGQPSEKKQEQGDQA